MLEYASQPVISTRVARKRTSEMQSSLISQEYFIENTPLPTLNICTTGLSKAELERIQFPAHIKLQTKLTPNTQLLVTYRAILTAKYIQALKWHIPIVSINFLYDAFTNYKKYEFLPLSGTRFSTSAITNEIYSNYLILLGATYEPNCSIFVDFLVCDDSGTEKYLFCQKYNIPIIRTKDVFQNKFELFFKTKRYDALRVGVDGIFQGKTFLLDDSLPKSLFNQLRRMIIDGEGTRVSILSERVDFIFTLDFAKYHSWPDQLFHYQYVFDCVDCNAVLCCEFYRITLKPKITILSNVIIVVDPNLENATEYKNKLNALGAILKPNIDMRTTHYITCDSKNDNKQYLAVLPEWVDQCLITFKMADTRRFSSNGSVLSLKRRVLTQRNKNIKVQFTSLPEFLKEKAMSKLKECGIESVDSTAYEGCTHLIMGQLSISEKFLCTLVSGGWILKPEFIEHISLDSIQNCSKFEWNCTSDTNHKDRKVIASVAKWRKQIERTGLKPFKRWRVKLYANESKLRTLSALIEAGGGVVTSENDSTHVFVDKGYTGEIKEKKSYSIDKLFAYLFKE